VNSGGKFFVGQKGGSNMMENKEIRGLLPHRYPFLLVDRVLEVEPGKRCVAVKNVTANEPFGSFAA